jgi:endoglucanase
VRRRLCLFVLAAPLFLAAALPQAAPRAEGQEKDAFHYNRLLGRGVNLGNALEAPREGEWGMVLKEEYFERIRQTGFDAVRIPVKWSAHAQPQAPYTVAPEFFSRIDWALDQALSRGLVTVLNVHHYGEMDTDPDAHLPRLTAIWRQIAQRYRSRPDRLYLELLNEPHDKLDDARWSKMVPSLLAAIRESNPRRIVIVGPSSWNSPDHLDRLQLPESDRMLIGTFHYYSPFKFTHQGAEWAQGSAGWLGTKWSGSEAEVAALRKDFDKATRWSEANRRPLYLGEFGAYSRADMDSRVQWTSAVAREAEKRGFSWAYWEFGAGFGIYDRDAGKWREPLLTALLPRK